MASAFAIAVAVAAPQAALAQDTGATAANTATNDTPIVVTGTKRETLLAETPISISAISGSDLEDRNVNSLQDFVYQTPSITLTNEGSGKGTLGIRGIISLDAAPGVGYYLNDVLLSQRTRNPDIGLFDINRVEILRGPQGTLYGDSSIGGTIRVITNAPNPDRFEGRAALSTSYTEHGDVNYGGDLMINVPLVDDRLALRVVGSGRYDDGYIDAVNLGLDNVNSLRSWIVRAELLWEPSPDFDLTLGAFIQDIHGNGEDVIDSRAEGLGQFLLRLEERDDQLQVYHATANLDVGPATITSVSAFSRREFHEVRDFSDFTVVTNPRLFTDLVGFPFNTWFPARGSDFERFSQELRIASNGEGPFNWIIGGYYERSTRHGTSVDTIVNYEVDPVTGLLLGGDGALALTFSDQSADVRLTQKSVFGELSYEVVDGLTGTVGLRYFDYHQMGTTFNNLVDPNTPSRVVTGDDSGTVMRANLSYQATPELLFYAQYSEGFRVGGTNAQSVLNPNIPPDFDADQTNNYEAGLKYEPNSSFYTALTLYRIDWKDIQLNVLDRATGDDFFFNAGTARSQGIEFEVFASPAEGLEVRAALGYINAEFTDTLLDDGSLLVGDPPVANDPRGPFITIEGGRIALVPDWTISTSATYRFPLGPGEGFVRGDLQYVGEAVSSAQTDIAETLFRYGEYTIAGIRFGYETDTYSVSLFIDNLFDERALVFDPLAFETFRSTINRPRTFGVDVGFHF